MPPLVGIVLGAVCALPFVMVLRLRNKSVGAGVVAVLVSFLIFHVAAVLARKTSPQDLVPLASCATLAFLGVIVAVALASLHE